MNSHEGSNAVQTERLTVRIAEATAMLGIGRSKLYELIGAGEIEIIKIGKATRILVRSLHGFVERQRAGASASS